MIVDQVPEEAVVRLAPDRDQVEAVSLVLQSVGIPHRIRSVHDGHAIVVATPDVPRAVRALDDQDRDVAELEAAKAADVPVPDRGRSYAGLALSVALLAFFVVTGPRSGASAWFRAGSSLARAVQDGHLWRAVTALTLHADIGHVVGNVVGAMIFVTAAARWLGPGLALLAVLGSGFLGNLATAWLTVPTHNSIGASTAVFGALGVLGGLQLRRRYTRVDPVRGRWARVVPVVAACAGVFAMMGVGGDDPGGQRSMVDVTAHLTGLGFGFLLGLVAAFLTRARAVPRLLDAALVVASLAIVVGSWFLAFRFPV